MPAPVRSLASVSLMSVGLALVMLPVLVQAEPRIAAGGIAGGTLGPSEYFPTFLVGLVGEGDLASAGRVALGLSTRVQLYSHREEEDYGSWGIQEELSAAIRLSLFDERDEARKLTPFISVRAGGALVERIPFRDSDSSELIGGYVLGGSIGIAFRWRENQPWLRALLSFDRPSFTTHDDKLGPVGELSLAVITTIW